MKYLTRPIVGLLRGAVTMDVDFGISLAADGGMYGTIADELAGQRFKRDAKGRYVREVEGLTIYLDLLTENPALGRGTALVDGIPVESFPGVQRALATRAPVAIKGNDAYEVEKQVLVPVSGTGPLLVLKINAFDVREQPKDAYDVLLAVSNHTGGSEAAIAAFGLEAQARNTGYSQAAAALRKHFVAEDQSGPLRCAAFALGEVPSGPGWRERREQIIQQTVSVGRALLGE